MHEDLVAEIKNDKEKMESAQANYQDATALRQKMIAKYTASIEKHYADMGESAQQAASAKALMDQKRAIAAVGKQTVKDLQAENAEVNKDYNSESVDRTAEIGAIQKAIGTLSSDSALESFKK